ncbi:MAG: hypothetical protein AAGE59_34275 [Cyanobacteria bacterium P01_F01_bin.86]
MTTIDPRRSYKAGSHQESYRRRSRTRSSRRTPESSVRQSRQSSKTSYDPIVNGLPGKTFALILGLWSVAININNVYSHFAPEATARFIATGILDFIASLPVFSLLAFLFRLGMGIAAYLLFGIMRDKKLMTNAIWLIIWCTCLYAAVVGLGQVILTFPLLLAAYSVAALQYMEIIFWNAKKPAAHLWALVIAAYAIEIWLQYDMMPFHSDYQTSLGLIRGLTSLGEFNWSGFQPIQCLFAAIGIFGIELSERILKIVERYA